MNYSTVQKEEKEYNKASLKSLPEGDTTTIEGTISFSRVDPYEKQDSLNKVFKDSLNRLYLVMPVKHSGIFEEETQLVELSPFIFNTLKDYLSYDQQTRNHISYSLQLKVRKVALGFPNGQWYSNHWKLLEIIRISKLDRAPYPL